MDVLIISTNGYVDKQLNLHMDMFINGYVDKRIFYVDSWIMLIMRYQLTITYS